MLLIFDLIHEDFLRRITCWSNRVECYTVNKASDHPVRKWIPCCSKVLQCKINYWEQGVFYCWSINVPLIILLLAFLLLICGLKLPCLNAPFLQKGLCTEILIMEWAWFCLFVVSQYMTVILIQCSFTEIRVCI